MAEMQMNREECQKQNKRIVSLARPQCCLVIGECGKVMLEKQDPHGTKSQEWYKISCCGDKCLFQNAKQTDKYLNRDHLLHVIAGDEMSWMLDPLLVENSLHIHPANEPGLSIDIQDGVVLRPTQPGKPTQMWILEDPPKDLA